MTTPTSMRSKGKIAQFLNKYPEVRWDRYTDDGKELCFYGWIKRDDGKFDYLELAFDKQGDEKWYSTSSAQHSKDFAKRGGFTHNDCLRVEDLFGDTVNAIKLSTPPAKGEDWKGCLKHDYPEPWCGQCAEADTPPAKEEEWEKEIKQFERWAFDKSDSPFCAWKGRTIEEVRKKLRSLRSQAYEEGKREMGKISDQTILRFQIVAVELAGRQKDDEAVKIINNIRGKYEELKDALKREGKA